MTPKMACRRLHLAAVPLLVEERRCLFLASQCKTTALLCTGTVNNSVTASALCDQHTGVKSTIAGSSDVGRLPSLTRSAPHGTADPYRDAVTAHCNILAPG
jgi:hypothetical protein